MPRTLLFAVALSLTACAKRQHHPTSEAPVEPSTATEARSPATVSRVQGTVLGHDGAVIPVAHVRVFGSKGEPPVETRVGDDGGFSLAVPRRGLARLEITGVDHEQSELLVVLDREPLQLDVRLGTYDRQAPLPALSAVVWTQDPGKSQPRMQPLAKQADGTFVAQVKTDAERVWVQLSGTAGPSRTVNGPQADAYEYDGGGDYRSVVLPSQGSVRIVVDPSRLVPPGQARTIVFADPDGPTARIVPVTERAAVENAAVARMLREANPDSPEAAQALIAAHDWAPARAMVRERLANESDDAVRRALLAAYFELGEFDPEHADPEDRARAKELAGTLAADDAGWSLFSGALLVAAELSDDPRHAERLAVLLDKELPPMIAAEALFSRLIKASLQGDTEGLRRTYTRLQAPRFEQTPYFFVAKQYDPDRAIIPGQKFPAFELATIAAKKRGAAKTVTNADLQGKVYLIDVWATWCKPCVAEMDNLHAAYAKHATQRRTPKGGRQFEILSVSVDKGTAEVGRFRKERFPMPWQHAHLSFDGAGKLFGIGGIPYAVLVDETGTILATSPELNGSSLDRMLDTVLAQPRPK